MEPRLAEDSASYQGLPSPGATYDERLALLDAVRQIHAEVDRLALPLEVPGAAQMRQERQAVLSLLESYLVGRLRSTERPLLVVIGGPTGAGKSTLLNSLVGANVSPAGVLRPTTRTPVLLHNPADADALPHQHLVPGLHPARHASHPGEDAGLRALRRVMLVPQAEVPAGIAILDSPDLDSWLTSNRELAAGLLGVADLWLFVTTGTDYADAIPWDLLDDAVRRRVTIATVLNRMRPAELTAVRRHFAEMLLDHGLASAPVFTVPELALSGGRIPYDHVQQLRSWLSLQSGVDDVREGYLGRAVAGTLDQIILSVRRLVDAAADQVVGQWRLRVDLRAVFSLAREGITDPTDRPAVSPALGDAWRASSPAMTGSAGRGLRRRLQATLRPADQPYTDVEAAVHADVRDVITAQLTTALHRVSERWNDHPAAASVGGPTLAHLPDDGAEQVWNAATGWLDDFQPAEANDEGMPHGHRWSALTLALATLALATWSTAADDVPAAAVDVMTAMPETDRTAAIDHARTRLAAVVRLLLGEHEARLARLLDGAAVSPLAGSALRSGLASLESLRDEAFRD